MRVFQHELSCLFCIWSLSFILYFNLVDIFSIVSIWFLTFQCRINLVSVVIFFMKIAYVANGQNKKLIFVDVAIN